MVEGRFLIRRQGLGRGFLGCGVEGSGVRSLGLEV